MFRFDEIASEIKERVEIPSQSGLDRYVGLEHLDPGSLKIWRWGSTGDVQRQKVLFKEGDIIFGRRNAYLRRVAVADFDGVCSAHAMVLRANSGVVVPEYLPYFMQTDVFWAAALRNSAGSLSPTINWSNIASEEFELPDHDEQVRIARALSAVDGVTISTVSAVSSLRRVRESSDLELIVQTFGLDATRLDLRTARSPVGWQIMSGEELLRQGYLVALQDGNHGSQYPKSSELGEEGMPYISASDISDDGDIDLAACKKILPERAEKLRIPPAAPGDVVLTHNATVGRVTRLPSWPDAIVASTSTTYYRCDEGRLLPDYLRWYLESPTFQFQLARVMTQSTRNQVPISAQKKLLFLVPPLPEQERFAQLRDGYSRALGSLSRKLRETARLKTELLGVSA